MKVYIAALIPISTAACYYAFVLPNRQEMNGVSCLKVNLLSKHMVDAFTLFKIILGSSIFTTISVAIVSLLAKTWIVERIKLAIQKEHTQFSTELQLEVKIRERAERVAEYNSLTRSLKSDSTEDEYRKANRLSWELAMWIPEDIYRQMVQAISTPNILNNELSVVIAVRKLLLKEKAGNLTADHVAHHAPGIGNK